MRRDWLPPGHPDYQPPLSIQKLVQTVWIGVWMAVAVFLAFLALIFLVSLMPGVQPPFG